MPSHDQILAALSTVQDPELHRSLTDLKMVREVRIQDGRVDVTIALTVPNCPLKDQIAADVRAAVAALPGVQAVAVHLAAMTDAARDAGAARGVPTGYAGAGFGCMTCT
jgi:ATP-binding protein involved in chromosome partitioning